MNIDLRIAPPKQPETWLCRWPGVPPAVCSAAGVASCAFDPPPDDRRSLLACLDEGISLSRFGAGRAPRGAGSLLEGDAESTDIQFHSSACERRRVALFALWADSYASARWVRDRRLCGQVRPVIAGGRIGQTGGRCHSAE